MKRFENESFEDYKIRRKESQIQLKNNLKGRFKKFTANVDGKQVEFEMRGNGQNRRTQRETGGRLFNNKKGIQMVVFGVDRYIKHIQRIEGKTIVHSTLVMPLNTTLQTARM